VAGVHPHALAVPPPPHVWGDVHMVEQLPHVVSRLRSASHPSESVPLQLSQLGASQLAIMHEPLPQVAVACARLQAVPQPPQLASVLSGVSQPFGCPPLQSPNPGVHIVIRQTPVAQLSLAFARLHDVPQPPQLVRLLSWVSQPLASPPLQSPQPPLQLWIRHVRSAHVAVAFARLQLPPQRPQLVSVRRSVSQPLP
jgi:hypothetical protein